MAFNSKGTLFVVSGDAVTALDPKTLEVKDTATLSGAAFATPPTVLSYQGEEFVAVGARDGRIVLFDAASLARSTVTAAVAPASALATWEDAAKNRYILLSTGAKGGSIVAYKVVGSPQSPKLEQAWTAELATPSAPIVVNGVVFALKSGSPSTAAVLYAYDGVSGKKLWNSGTSITSYARSTGLWSSNAQVYVATQDGTVYAFGFAMDRHL
jgi:outer membrane protein assembly factor BamB